MLEKNLNEICSKVMSMKENAENIKNLSNDFPAVQRNIHRIMASIKMIEINTVDLKVYE
jgi:hypothetical protein